MNPKTIIFVMVGIAMITSGVFGYSIGTSTNQSLQDENEKLSKEYGYAKDMLGLFLSDEDSGHKAFDGIREQQNNSIDL